MKINMSKKIKIITLGMCMLLIAMSFSTVTTAQKHDEDEMLRHTLIENTTPYLFEKSRTKNIYTSTNDDRYRYVPNKIKPVLDNWRYQTDFFPVSATNHGLIPPSEYEYGIKGLNISHYVPGELVIKLKPGATTNIRYERGIPQVGLASLDELNNRYNVRAMKPITIDKTRNNPLSQVYQLIIPEHTGMLTLMKDYGKDPFVEYAEPNYIYHTCLFPNDPKFDQQWALHNTGQTGGTIDADIDAPEAWDIETGDPNVTIAVIDTGVDYLHPDLAGNIWVSPGEDLNHNGIVEGENFLDTGTDGLLDIYEPGFDPLTNPDPNGDNYDPEASPDGTEGNFKYDLGEPFDDFGIDAIGPDSLYYVGPDPDGSEGNGVYDPGDKDGIDSDGNNYIDDIRGWDYVGHISGWPFPDNDPMDDHAHGTHCSGIISAVTNNSIGIAGVCWNCKIMPLKFLDWGGSGSDVDGAKAIMYAVDNGADVISMSWGGPIPSSELLNEALVYAHENGVVLVAAAGNDNNEAPHYPSSSPYVISVAATDRDDVKASFSNYGLTVDVSAPGVRILSTVPEPGSIYHSFSGTSMACPHVAGLAGLLLSKNHSLTVEMVETIIVNSVDEIDSDVYIGSGRINAYKAIQREPAIALLDTPLEWDDAKGVIDINGTVWASDFQYYIVEYGKGRNPDTWVEIINSTIMVENSVLASLDTTVLDDGFYTIKLRLKCGIGGIYQDLTRKVVNNEYNQFFVDDDNTMGPWYGTLEFPYQYIRDAVDDAGHYDTVYVFNGTYLGGFVIERSIELLGENKYNTVISQAYLDGIYIVADHVQISGFTVRENWWGIQLAPLSKDCVVSGNIITENQQAGIGVLFSSYNNITDNEIINNPFGIYFFESSYNTVSENTVRNSEVIGILIFFANNNLISMNMIINSGLFGVSIEYSLNNAVIDNNLMSNGIRLWTTVLHSYNMIFWNTHTIENNVLNGKPIRYYKNMSDFVVPNNTAQVILANCTNVTIQNLNLLDTNMGIEIGYSSHITISENTIISNNGNSPGIILWMSSNNTINENIITGALAGIDVISYTYGEDIISGNIITDCSEGIYLQWSFDKSLISENIIKNCYFGVHISYESSYTTISGNDITGCEEGVIIDAFSDNNLVTDNNIRGNNEHGIWLWYAPNNTISENGISNNKYGINLSNFCDNNAIQGNALFNNSMVGIFIYNSKDNVIYHNNVIDTTWDNAYDSSNLNTWYNTTLKQGNRWDDYTGRDEDGDGIGDTPYNISGGVNQDLYPLMSPYGGSVINIDTGKVFSSIQQSIDDATTLDGHTIHVCPDVYYEDIVVNKAITLKGEKKEGTIIDGNGSGDVVRMVADGVNMNGFTIQHSGLTDVGINIGSNSNIISDNNITDNNVGVKILSSYLNSIISHNNFVDNTLNACDYGTNAWDDGYPSGGNYWSDYTGEDVYYGPDQNIPGSDGIGDTPYNIPPGNNQDRYPLVNPWNGTLPPVPPSNTVYVDDDYNLSTPGWGYDHFDTIDDGIKAVVEQGAVIVKSGIYQGTYYGTSVMVNKTVTIIGENKYTTIIDGGGGELPAVYVMSANNVTISGFTIKNSITGIGVYLSDHTFISNTVITENDYGISVYYSSSNIIVNNSLSDNNYGIFLMSSNNNNISNNLLCSNLKDINDDGENTYSLNRFFHNLQSCMLTIEEVNRWKNLSDVVRFNISMFNANGDPSGCNYSITTRPVETVLVSKDGNNIAGNFTLSRPGTYSLLVIINDENNNTAKRRYTFFVNPSGLAKTRYYLRSVDPTHGQPTGSDVGSLLFTPPTEEESWWCSTWIQNSPDELPENYPLSILDDIDIYSWYKTQVKGYMGVQRFVTLGTEVDTSESVEAVAEYTWIDKNFGNLNWSMDYSWMWYLLSLKLKGYMPHWMTIPSQLSYANFTHSYTTTPAIKSISNNDVIILSATSHANNTNNANIVLEGSGTTTLVVQMLNTSLIYSVKFDGVACNNSNCTFTQQNGELNISLRLGSELNEHTLDIEGNPGLPDLIITNFSAEYLSDTPAHISAEYNSHATVKLIATIKNDGYTDITSPFIVSFYGTNTQIDAKSKCICIGTVEIPSLAAGETAEAIIYWKLQPEISMIQVFADSTRVIGESNESNNRASVVIPSFLPWKSLKETADMYTRLSQQYETQCAQKVAEHAKKAISGAVYTNPSNYVKTMKIIAELELKAGDELEGQVPDSLLCKYQETVKHLITLIDELMKDDTSQDIVWNDAKAVAELQLQICKIINDMIRHKDVVHLDIQKTIGAK